MSHFRIRYIPILASLAEAKLPFPSGAPTAELKNADDVTFDPLGVAAILSNPRADLSAARLYIQLDHKAYHWPHTMMVGGALPPLKMLVAHLSMNVTSIHPAITMCGNDTKLIPIRSDMIFKELPVNLSNTWLNDLIEFRPSEIPGNDFMLVYVDSLDKTAQSKAPGSWLRRLALNLIGLLTGLLLVGGTAFGILTADIWAVLLFFFYTLHWVASTLISFTTMVHVDIKGHIVPDSTTRYAVYQRPEGGTVVFKGRQDTMESWARRTYEFNKNRKTNFLHWFWMTSGAMSAVASVACMVNMRGYMQLGFLAVLFYSSVAEILATQISRQLQLAARGAIFSSLVDSNASRTRGIIRATIEAPAKCRLEGLNWIALGLLPKMQVFEQMLELLAHINRLQAKEASGEIGTGLNAEEEVRVAIEEYKERNAASGALALRIADEARNAWQDSRPMPEDTRQQNKPGIPDV